MRLMSFNEQKTRCKCSILLRFSIESTTSSMACLSFASLRTETQSSKPKQYIFLSVKSIRLHWMLESNINYAVVKRTQHPSQVTQNPLN